MAARSNNRWTRPGLALGALFTGLLAAGCTTGYGYYGDGYYSDGYYEDGYYDDGYYCLLYTSPSPRDQRGSRMPSSA